MHRLFVACLAAALIAAAPAAGLLGGSAAGSETYPDTRGEDAAGPDITEARVSNDDAGGITFRIAVPNRPALRDDMRITIWIDADDDPATGVGGMDYRLLYDYYLHGDRSAWLFRCEASICTNLGQPKVPLTYAGGPTIAVDDSDLGGTRRFRFRVVVTDGVAYDPVAKTFDLTRSHADRAPNADPPWLYEVRAGAARLAVASFEVAPDPPRAGKQFTARLTATRTDTGARVTHGRTTCSARIGKKPVPLRSRTFTGGIARCSWGIPTGTRGKTLRGTIGVSAAGKTASKTFVKRVG